ncbi:hypothetical protein AeMF1_016514 [Aphanomyces euteiches]|nr:hypothetical protein AeMF1_016514 [Aphanomyces euteiches]
MILGRQRCPEVSGLYASSEFCISSPRSNTNTTNLSLCIAVAAAAGAVVSTMDGRMEPAAKNEIYTVRNLRCSRSVYLEIVQRVESRWDYVHAPLFHNVVFHIPDRVACALHYLTHADGYESTAALFGISLGSARVYTIQICEVLNSYLKETVSLPKSPVVWETIRQGFEQIAGIPHVYGAIDGSLIPIKRFADFEGCGSLQAIYVLLHSIGEPKR